MSKIQNKEKLFHTIKVSKCGELIKIIKLPNLRIINSKGKEIENKYKVIESLQLS